MLSFFFFKFDKAPEADRNDYLNELRVRTTRFGTSSNILPTADDIVAISKHLSDCKVISNQQWSTEAMKVVQKLNDFSYKAHAQAWSDCRCLFRTSRHSLFGLGPVQMQAGDEVWLLESGTVPYILRPIDGGRYKYMGEAYVHGIMHGEWLKQHQVSHEFVPIEIV